MKTKAPAVWPFLLGTGFMLGLGIPLSKAAAAQGVSSVAFALWPTVLAAVLLSVLATTRHGGVPVSLPLARYALIAGLLGHALPMTAVFWLSSRAGSGFASLAFTLPPVFTLAFSLLIRLEHFRWTRLTAVALGMCGAALLVFSRGGSMEGSWGAVVVVLAIPAMIGAGNVYRSLHTPAGVPGEWLASLTLGASASLLLLVGSVMGTVAIPAAPLALAFLGAQVLALVIGYALYFELQRRAEAVTFSFMGYVMTLTGVVAGVGLLGESLPVATWPAVALILSAFWIIQRTAAPIASNQGTPASVSLLRGDR